MNEPHWPCSAHYASIYTGLGAAVGAGIGAGINLILRNRDVLYDADRTATLTLAPILSPTRKGLAFSMTWR